MTRPTEVTCSICKRPIVVLPRGRVPDAHPACHAVQWSIQRMLSAVDVAKFGLSEEEAQVFRTLVAKQVFSGLNVRFNNKGKKNA